MSGQQHVGGQEQPVIDTGKMHIPEQNLLRSHHNHMGFILAALILLLAVIFGGLFLWGVMLRESTPAHTSQLPVNNEPRTIDAKTNAETLRTMSTSDEIPAIEEDLHNTSFDTLTNDVDQADKELMAALPQ